MYIIYYAYDIQYYVYNVLCTYYIQYIYTRYDIYSIQLYTCIFIIST